MLAYRQLEQVKICMQIKILHDLVFVEGDRARRKLQSCSRLLHRFSSREQLKNLPLPMRQGFIVAYCRMRHFLRDEQLACNQFLNRIDKLWAAGLP